MGTKLEMIKSIFYLALTFTSVFASSDVETVKKELESLQTSEALFEHLYKAVDQKYFSQFTKTKIYDPEVVKKDLDIYLEYMKKPLFYSTGFLDLEYNKLSILKAAVDEEKYNLLVLMLASGANPLVQVVKDEGKEKSLLKYVVDEKHVNRTRIVLAALYNHFGGDLAKVKKYIEDEGICEQINNFWATINAEAIKSLMAMGMAPTTGTKASAAKKFEEEFKDPAKLKQAQEEVFGTESLYHKVVADFKSRALEALNLVQLSEKTINWFMFVASGEFVLRDRDIKDKLDYCWQKDNALFVHFFGKVSSSDYLNIKLGSIELPLVLIKSFADGKFQDREIFKKVFSATEVQSNLRCQLALVFYYVQKKAVRDLILEVFATMTSDQIINKEAKGWDMLKYCDYLKVPKCEKFRVQIYLKMKKAEKIDYKCKDSELAAELEEIKVEVAEGIPATEYIEPPKESWFKWSYLWWGLGIVGGCIVVGVVIFFGVKHFQE